MLLADALALSEQFITTREKHMYYYRCCELSTKYKALITGENMETLLIRFDRREDEDAFAQRVALTIAITPAVTAALMKPYNKVLRNDKVKKHFDFKSKSRNDIIQKMYDGFYGRRVSKNKGFDYWLKTRYPMLQFVDPNSWVIYEWSKPESQAAIIQPRPYEVPSHNAWNWDVENENPLWLWMHKEIVYKRLIKTDAAGKKVKIAEARAAANFVNEPGEMFTLYDEDYTITYTQVDPEYLRNTGYVYAANEELWQAENKFWYLKRVYEPKLSMMPGFRVGYMADPETNGETFVNGWHDAMPYLMKSVKAVSEMDLTIAHHVFPQKMQYVQRCPGVDKTTRCDYGRVGDGQLCKRCKGLGYTVHTTAQDVMYFPLPDEGTLNNEVLDLEKLLVYKAPPVDLLTFQKSYIQYLVTECTNAVFTQTQQSKASGPNSGNAGAPAPVSATEINMNSEGVQDAVFPFVEKWKEIWIEGILVFGKLVGIPDVEAAEVTCIFPSSLRIKTLDDLLADLKTARDAGAQPFLIDQINNDIAELIYQGDVIAELMYKTRHKFYPFNGQSPDEIAYNVSSNYVSLYTKVLYANFEAIFQELDLDNPGFWFLTYDAQAILVDEMVQKYMDEINQDTALNLMLPGDTPPPGGDPNNPGDGNNPPTPPPPTA